jgi:hypothetical protein
MTQEEIKELREEIRSYEESQKRIEDYKSLYTEKDADILGMLHAQYPWVAPEILIPAVFAGQESLLPEIAKVAAKETMKNGATPQMFRENYIRKNMVTKPIVV